jgi:hypothetical protein
VFRTDVALVAVPPALIVASAFRASPHPLVPLPSFLPTYCSSWQPPYSTPSSEACAAGFNLGWRLAYLGPATADPVTGATPWPLRVRVQRLLRLLLGGAKRLSRHAVINAQGNVEEIVVGPAVPHLDVVPLAPEVGLHASC